MGFGLLFFGYIATFLMSLNNFGFVFRLTGCAIMLSAFSKLSQYERSFLYVRISCFGMLLASLWESIITLSLDYEIFDLGFAGDTAKNICISVFFSAAVILHFFLYRSIYKLSSDVGVEKIKLNSMRFGAFAVIEIVILISALAMWYISPSIAKYIVMFAILYPYVIFFLNILLFLNTISKFANIFPQSKILTMGIGYKIRLIQIKSTIFIHIFLICQNSSYFS